MSKRTKPEFVICIDNAGYDVSLEVRKIYVAIPDAHGAASDLIRVIDESGEDYLYPSDRFIPIELPENVRAALRRAS